jgi:hypothetical protein
MTRIPQLREDDPLTPPEAREFLDKVERTMGEVFNALRLLANHPAQAKALIEFVKAVRYRNTLTPALTELHDGIGRQSLPLLNSPPHGARLERRFHLREAASSRDDHLPDGVYSRAEAAVIRYAQRSTRGLAIDCATYRSLTEHFSTPQIIDICLNVGLSQITNRFNATFLPDVDQAFMRSNEEAYAEMGGPPVEYPPKPAE